MWSYRTKRWSGLSVLMRITMCWCFSMRRRPVDRHSVGTSFVTLRELGFHPRVCASGVASAVSAVTVEVVSGCSADTLVAGCVVCMLIGPNFMTACHDTSTNVRTKNDNAGYTSFFYVFTFCLIVNLLSTVVITVMFSVFSTVVKFFCLFFCLFL